MKRLLLCLFFVFAPIAASATPQEEGQAVFEKFLNDFSSGNADAVARNFAPEAMFWGTISPTLITTPQGVKQYFVTAFEKLPGMKASPVGQVSVVTLANNVIAMAGVWRMDRMNDGKPVVSFSRNMSTLVKRDGRWVITSFSNAPQTAP
jgi:hypothetical protein